VDSKGSLIHSYRKHFLYEIDKRWAEEGEKFEVIDISISTKTYKIGLGICMDINPYEFKDERYKLYEMASEYHKQKVDIVLLSTNWTSSKPLDANSKMDTINYWVERLRPFHKYDKVAYFISADRIGKEETVQYSGSSCVVQFPSVKLLKCLDTEKEGVIFVELIF
jgi:protein N-terminal amidase